MAWFTCVNYYCFSYVMIYAPRVKDFVLSLERFLVVVGIFFFLENSNFKETVHLETYGC